MSNGAHTLELATFSTVNADSGESPEVCATCTWSCRRSPRPTSRRTADWQSGEIDPTRDGVRLRIDKVTEDLIGRPTPHSRPTVASSLRNARAVSASSPTAPSEYQTHCVLPEDDDEIQQAALSIAIDPDFERTQFVFVLHIGSNR